MTTNTTSVDLTNVQAVKSWLQISQATTSDDGVIQDAITAFSIYVLRLTGRGSADGSVPVTSPFCSPVNYDEFYDGNGNLRMQLRNWPITAVSSVNINGAALQQSTAVSVPGWVIDGDKQFISIRGGYSRTPMFVPSYYNQGYSSRGFCQGLQNIEVVYTAGFAAVPFDLEMAARKVVALNYKRRGWIGQRSQAMAAGAGTISYNTMEMPDDCRRTISYYQVRVQ